MASLRLIAYLLIFFSSILVAQDTRKKGFEYFDMIYSINLPQSSARKTHIVKEFNRLGIKNYKIFVATDQDSSEVIQLMQSSVVQKFPPCFRCKKNFCKCANNVLMKPQIGNWLSFINLFNEIVKSDYEFVLITEDDVKFTDDARHILDKLINAENFAKYGIDLNRPVLLNLYDDLDNIKQQDLRDLCFRKERKVSNPCFVVNKLFAISFLQNLHNIDSTSDTFIHKVLLDIDPTIQYFSCYPKPAYELSTGNTATFYSTIRAKGIDLDDKWRQAKQKQRIEYWEYLWHKLSFRP